jgi:hypothetical protein
VILQKLNINEWVRAFTRKMPKAGLFTFLVPGAHFWLYSIFGRVECADSKKQ